MNEKFEKAKTFVKEHKKEIAIGAGAAVIGTVIFMVTKKEPKINGIDGDKLRKVLVPKLEKLEVPETLLEKGITEVSSTKPNEWLDIWTNNVSLSELGNVGKELCKAYDWKPEQTISGVVGINLNN